MDINERGIKKWTSLMLPEHVQMLEKLDKEQYRKGKPIIDEQVGSKNYVMLQGA